MGLRRHVFAAAITSFALVAFEEPARACESCETIEVAKPTSNLIWPDGQSRVVHMMDSIAFGWCSRENREVAASGMCADIAFGFDAVLSGSIPTLRLMGDLGFGSTVGAQSNLIVGTSRGSGGPYAVTRVMLGVDITRLYFMRLGVQLKEAVVFNALAPGLQIVADMGTRAFGRFEFGFRGYVGFDGELFGDGSNANWFPVTFGIMLFSRLRVR